MVVVLARKHSDAEARSVLQVKRLPVMSCSRITQVLLTGSGHIDKLELQVLKGVNLLRDLAVRNRESSSQRRMPKHYILKRLPEGNFVHRAGDAGSESCVVRRVVFCTLVQKPQRLLPAGQR